MTNMRQLNWPLVFKLGILECTAPCYLIASVLTHHMSFRVWLVHVLHLCVDFIARSGPGIGFTWSGTYGAAIRSGRAVRWGRVWDVHAKVLEDQAPEGFICHRNIIYPITVTVVTQYYPLNHSAVIIVTHYHLPNHSAVIIVTQHHLPNHSTVIIVMQHPLPNHSAVTIVTQHHLPNHSTVTIITQFIHPITAQ